MLNRSLNTTLDRMLTWNRALDEAFASSVNGDETSRVWVPAIDVTETRDAYVVLVDLPGVDRAAVDISFEKNILTISGEKPALVGGEQDVRVFAAERVAGTFTRSLRLPEYVDGDRISAEFKDGLLTVTVPKAELAQARKIEIK